MKLTFGNSTLLSAMIAAAPIGAHSQQVWFAPQDNLPRGDQPAANQDFPQLFDATPGWSAKADVFLMSPYYSAHGTDDQLRRIAAFLKQHQMALAVGIGAAEMDNAAPTPGECGFGVEGLVRPGRNAGFFKRLKSLALDVQFVAMDEPLTFAHFYRRKNACGYSVEDTARRVAASISQIRQYYANVKVIDTEAPTIIAAGQWNSDFPVWLAAYRQATGRPLDGIILDVDWRLPWHDWASSTTTIARQQGVAVGIILGGIGPGASDAEAIATRKQSAQAVAASGLTFDIVDIANWKAHPTRNLPESDPDTLTGFLSWFQTHNGAGRSARSTELTPIPSHASAISDSP